MANVATLAVQLTAKTGRFTSGMKNATRDVSLFSKVTNLASSRLLAFAGSAAVAAGAYLSVRGVTRAISEQMKLIDSTAKVADKLGVSTEALGAYHHAAKLAGVESGTFDMALQRMVRRVAEAAHGTGEAKSALAEMGLDARRLAQIAPQNQLLAIADSMQRFANQGDRVRLAMKLFDSEGVALVNMLQNGSAGLIGAARDAEQLRLTFNRIDAKTVEMANDAVARLQGLLTGVKQSLAIGVAPFVQMTADKLTAMGIAGENSSDKILNGMERVAKVFDHVYGFIRQGEAAWYALQMAAQSSIAKILLALDTTPGGSVQVNKIAGKLIAQAELAGKHAAKVAKQGIKNSRISDQFQEIREAAEESAARTINNTNAMAESATAYAKALEEAKERAKALADASKQQFRFGPLQTIAINTGVNRALFNQQRAGAQAEKVEVGGPVLEAMARGIDSMDRRLADGIALRAT